VNVEAIRALIASCQGENGRRDRVIFLTLFDTGLRAAELLALNAEDVDLVTGQVVVRHGKGDKRRVVYLGSRSRKEMRGYLKERGFEPGALFRREDGERLKYEGLRFIVKRRAEKAKVKAPGLHDFRRAFAVACLRNGIDLIKLAELMGHSTLEVTRRYVALVDEDLRLAHALSGPVDRSL
jgi:site-specific recombinase XerD